MPRQPSPRPVGNPGRSPEGDATGGGPTSAKHHATSPVMLSADHPGGLVAGGRTSGRMTGTPRRACSWAGPPVQRLRPGRPVGASAVELVSARADPPAAFAAGAGRRGHVAPRPMTGPRGSGDGGRHFGASAAKCGASADRGWWSPRRPARGWSAAAAGAGYGGVTGHLAPA
jgi:hypothetical protein